MKQRFNRIRFAAALPLLLCMLSPAARAAPAQCANGSHQYVRVNRVEPTATEDGEESFECGVCGQRYTEILYATSHVWGGWIVDKKPTCTAQGQRHRVCSRGFSHTEYGAIAALGHDYQKTVAREAGCLTPGLARFVCAHDPAHAYEEELPAAGSHSFGAWHTVTPAGEGTEGEEARACALDGFLETRMLPALPEIVVTQAEKPFPLVDVILVTTNLTVAGGYLILLYPYILCFRYMKKRRRRVEYCQALRREVEERYEFR